MDDDTAIRYNRGCATEFHVDTKKSIVSDISYKFARCDMDGNPILFSEEKLKQYKNYLPYAVVFYPDEHQELRDLLTSLKSKKVYFNMYRKEIHWCLDRIEKAKLAPEYKAIVKKVLMPSKSFTKSNSFKKSTSFTSNEGAEIEWASEQELLDRGFKQIDHNRMRNEDGICFYSGVKSCGKCDAAPMCEATRNGGNCGNCKFMYWRYLKKK